MHWLLISCVFLLDNLGLLCIGLHVGPFGVQQLQPWQGYSWPCQSSHCCSGIVQSCPRCTDNIGHWGTVVILSNFYLTHTSLSENSTYLYILFVGTVEYLWKRVSQLRLLCWIVQVKAALGRATMLMENLEKHGRIQALVGLICTMMEACPAQINQPPNVCFKQQQHGQVLSSTHSTNEQFLQS